MICDWPTTPLLLAVIATLPAATPDTSPLDDTVAIAGLALAQTNVAPEIEAPDLDGVKFKLSDYRGKVVLLDFWGYW